MNEEYALSDYYFTLPFSEFEKEEEEKENEKDGKALSTSQLATLQFVVETCKISKEDAFGFCEKHGWKTDEISSKLEENMAQN